MITPRAQSTSHESRDTPEHPEAKPQSQKFSIPGVKNIIAVLGGKGGTGKTFLATNLAISLAKQGKRTGLFDADISSPTVFSFLGISTKITPNSESKLQPVEKYGVKVMSMAGLCGSDSEPIAYRGTILTKVLQQLLKETMWGELDFLIIDFPSGMSDIALTLLQQFEITSVVFVATADRASMMTTSRSITMINMLKIPIFGVVENMRGDIFGDGQVAIIAKNFSIPFIGSIPMRKQAITYANQGIPAIFHVEEFEIIISKIARTLSEKYVI